VLSQPFGFFKGGPTLAKPATLRYHNGLASGVFALTMHLYQEDATLTRSVGELEVCVAFNNIQTAQIESAFITELMNAIQVHEDMELWSPGDLFAELL
jgi:hypothetical protein